MTDSRPTDEPNVVRRRRYGCISCGGKFTTHEVLFSATDQAVLSAKVEFFQQSINREVRRAASEIFGEIAAKPRAYTK